jgi:hypothetical protein
MNGVNKSLVHEASLHDSTIISGKGDHGKIVLGLLGRIDSGGAFKIRVRNLFVRAIKGNETITSPVIQEQLEINGTAEPNPAPRIPIE